MNKKENLISLEESKSIGQRLRVARLLTNLSRPDFCDKYNINLYTLSSLELGRIKLSKQKMQQLLMAFRAEGISCTVQWILKGEGTPAYRLQENETIQTLSNSAQKVSHDDVFSIFQEIDAFKKGSKRAIVILIQDDAMLPWYQPGDYVGGKLMDQQDIADFLGDICLVEIEPEKFIVRHIFQDKDNVILSSINPHSKLCVPLVIKSSLPKVAKIFWHRKPE